MMKGSVRVLLAAAFISTQVCCQAVTPTPKKIEEIWMFNPAAQPRMSLHEETCHNEFKLLGKECDIVMERADYDVVEVFDLVCGSISCYLGKLGNKNACVKSQIREKGLVFLKTYAAELDVELPKTCGVLSTEALALTTTFPVLLFMFA